MTNKDTILSLIRLGIGHDISVPIQEIYWPEVQSFAARQGLSAVILDGIERLPESKRPSKDLLLQWIGENLQSYEYRYELYCRAIADLALFYNSHGLKMMILKGYSCSLNWPKPEHRPCGDIDIWMFRKQKEADALMSTEKGIVIDKSHHHHTTFDWHGFTVENHYDFINIHHHKSNAEFDAILKGLGNDDINKAELFGEIFILPSANLQALFLIKHLAIHFAAESIYFRQVLDWGFHVQAHSKEIAWPWLVDVLKRYGMMDFYNSINAICVENLGFGSSIFPVVQYNPDLKEKVLNEIINPEFGVELPSGFISRVSFKFHRWRGSAWKHKICYQDSLWSAFWHGVWTHFLKPSSI